MRRNIYLAARYSRKEEMQRHRDTLVAAGHFVTCSWIDTSHEELKEGGADTKHLRAEFAQQDYDDLCCADTCISFTEEPRTATRGGRHVEFGIALEREMELIVIGPIEHIFHEMPDVQHFNTWEEFWAQYSSK